MDNSKIITIERDGKVFAILFKKSIKADGVRFLTPQNYTLQLGLIEHPGNHVIRTHAHNQKIKYHVDTTQEFLYIEKGQVRIDLLDMKGDFIKRVLLSAKDFILFVDGGHAIKILKKARILEIKQGPYPGDKLAKIFFDNYDPSKHTNHNKRSK